MIALDAHRPGLSRWFGRHAVGIALFVLQLPAFLSTAFLLDLVFRLVPPYPDGNLTVAVALALLFLHRLTALVRSRRARTMSRLLMPLAPASAALGAVLLQQPDLAADVAAAVLETLRGCAAIAIPCAMLAGELALIGRLSRPRPVIPRSLRRPLRRRARHASRAACRALRRLRRARHRRRGERSSRPGARQDISPRRGESAATPPGRVPTRTRERKRDFHGD